MCFSFPVFFIFISSHRYFGQKPRNLGENTLMMGWLPQNDLLGKAGLCVSMCMCLSMCVPLATSLEFSLNHSKENRTCVGLSLLLVVSLICK